MEKQYLRLPVDELIPYENNPRINDEAAEAVAKSIEQCGYIAPIITDEDMVILGGHTRLLAMRKLGIKECEVLVVSGLSDEQKRKYRLLDNKTGELAEWDFEMLENELFDLDFGDLELDWDIDDDFELEESASLTTEKDDEYFYFDKQEIRDDIVANWKTYSDLGEFVSYIIDVPTAKYQFNRLCQGYNDGYNISLLFNPHRLTTRTKKGMSIFEAIQTNETYAKEFARYMVNVQNKVVVPTQYYKFIGIGSGGVQYVNEFQPYLARDIYKKYCNDGDKILNPCAGWGGRLLGIASCLFEDIEYTEVEPSTATFNGLVRLKEFLNLGDNYKQINLPFENVELKENYFDFVFTSPPYFDTEIYSEEDTQSYKGCSTYDDWKRDFLYVMLDKIVKSMKVHATCLLNVGKVRYPIDDDIVDYLREKYGITCKRVGDFKIGGAGIGARTDDDGEGEPFIEFKKR